MEYTVATGSPHEKRTDCLVLPVYEGNRFGGPTRTVDEASNGYLSDAVGSLGDSGELGRSVMLLRVPGTAARSVMLLGLGCRSKLNGSTLRAAAGQAGLELHRHGAKGAVAPLLPEAPGELDDYRAARHLVEAVDHAVYRYRASRDDTGPRSRSCSLTILAGSQRQAESALRGVNHGKAIAGGVAFARSLGDLPGNFCTPTHLGEQARKLGQVHPHLEVSILGESEMKELRMETLLSVSKGSREPARLIVMEMRNGPLSEKPVALVGKGVTFDAGGISLKQSRAMDEMKFDMCGAAVVLGAVKAVSDLDLPINLVAVVPAAENLPDGAANKPGDVVTSMSGQTIEILNTDAEGRLMLCDALTYVQRYKPDTVIDVATLTGACVAALGDRMSGLFSTDPELAGSLTAAGERAADPAWELPLRQAYQEDLETPFADVANIGGPKAGATLAACFLSRFTEGLRWAHLDVAGPAWDSGDRKGATGRPLYLLAEYLVSRVEGKYTQPPRPDQDINQTGIQK